MKRPRIASTESATAATASAAGAAVADGSKDELVSAHLHFVPLFCRLHAEAVQHQVSVDDARGQQPLGGVDVHVLQGQSRARQPHQDAHNQDSRVLARPDPSAAAQQHAAGMRLPWAGRPAAQCAAAHSPYCPAAANTSEDGAQCAARRAALEKECTDRDAGQPGAASAARRLVELAELTVTGLMQAGVSVIYGSTRIYSGLLSPAAASATALLLLLRRHPGACRLPVHLQPACVGCYALLRPCCIARIALLALQRTNARVRGRPA